MNPEDLKKILPEYNLTETSPVILLRESGDNYVFSVGEKDKKIFRVSKRLPIEDIKFEYETNQFLANNGLHVAKWLMTKTGNISTILNGSIVVGFDFLAGHQINVDKDHLPSNVQAYNAGKELGLLGNIGVNFKSQSPRKRDILSELKRVISIEKTFTDNFEGGKDFVGQVKKALDFGLKQKETYGLIHNDYRPGNVFFDNNDSISGIIDFDWSCIGPIIKDVALAVVEWSFPDGANEPNWEVFEAFLNGYNSVSNRKLNRADADLVAWIKFTTLSDASTYFCDLALDPTSTKRIIKSYMYRKYLFFSK